MYGLSIHYLNVTSEQQDDASGIEIGVTGTTRPADAAMHWIGKLSFELPPRTQTNIATNCQPNGNVGPAHIVATTPHMHRLGRHATLEIVRAAGDSLKLLDAPYDFDEQRTFDIAKVHSPNELVLNKGDQINATCAFDNTTDMTVKYGEASADEMCFISVLAWPVGSVSNHLPFASSLGLSSEQACLEP